MSKTSEAWQTRQEWADDLAEAFNHLLHNYGPYTIESAGEMCEMLEVLTPLPYPESFNAYKAMLPTLGEHWRKVPLLLIKGALYSVKGVTPIQEVDHSHAKLAIRRIPLTLLELAWEKIRKPPPKPPASLPH